MHSEIDKLHQIYADLSAGRTATPTTIRDFLSWFGVQRRTYWNVTYIDDQMEKCDLQTVPNYMSIWVGTPITFELISQKGKREEDAVDLELLEEATTGITQPETEGEAAASLDPSFRVGKLEAAMRGIVSLKPNDPIGKAMTIMMARNFSQLPVMTTEREVKGVVSWTSIGERFAAGFVGNEAQHYMDEHQEISISASLFASIRIIAELNYVLVKDASRKYTGIITANDIAFQFEETSTPFLLLSEIENHLRVLVGGKLTIEQIRATCDEKHLPSDFEKVADLTFGNHVHILENIDNWTKVGIKLDRTSFISELREANRIRNEVMHFDSDAIAEIDLLKLRNISRLLDTLRRIS